MKMRPAWLANTTPDCLFEICQLAQVTAGKFEAEKDERIRRLNRPTRHAVPNRVSLKIPVLDMKTLKVIGFWDSSFANKSDISSQLGNICLLGDHTGYVVPIHFKSYKSRRVTRSSMASELIAFSNLSTSRKH